MKIRPWGDLVLVKVLEEAERSAGGIIKPDVAKGKQPGRRAEVLAVGPGRWLATGEREPMDVKPGDTVILANYAGAGKDVEVDGVKCTFVHEIDCVAILPREDVAQAAA